MERRRRVYVPDPNRHKRVREATNSVRESLENEINEYKSIQGMANGKDKKKTKFILDIEKKIIKLSKNTK